MTQVVDGQQKTVKRTLLQMVRDLFHPEVLNDIDEQEEFVDTDPQVDMFCDDGSDQYSGHLYREIKIDLEGWVYFKINGRWVLQTNIDEIHLINLRTFSNSDINELNIED